VRYHGSIDDPQMQGRYQKLVLGNRPRRPETSTSDTTVSLEKVIMTLESRRLAGILLILLPTVMYGGTTLLSMLMNDPSYMANPLRQNFWRAGHAHAGVLLVLALVALRYVDDTALSSFWKWIARSFIPIAAILMPFGFFLSVASPLAESPNAFIYSTYLGAAVLAIGVLVLGVGLLMRGPAPK